MKANKFLITALLLLAWIGGVEAQSLQNIQNLKVENLSDAQIEQLIKRAESSGMNEQQLEAMAMERGMPAEEVFKLRQRIQEIRSGRTDQNRQTSQKEFGRSRQIEGEKNVENIFDSIRKADPYFTLTPKQKKIFGYKVFHNRELDFSPSMNIPTPQNYTIGTGDQLLIDIYGASQQNYDLKVNPEGKVFIPHVGPVQVAGLTIEAATSRLRSSLDNIYSGLSTESPNTFLQIRLGDIRTITVSMVGELTKPGTYTLPSFASVFNAMFAAGGPNENGSFRSIQVYRDSKLVGEVDIYDFLLRGNQEGNVMLKDNDVVIVQPVQTRVEIEGPVRRPGLFEVKPDESLKDVLNFAGGFDNKAFQERISVTRSTGTQMKVDDIGADFYDTFSPKDGDHFKVGQILKRYENRILVTGAVFRPGEFALTEGLTVKELIKRAGGLKGDAFTNRATLYRTGNNLRQEIISIDLEGVMKGNVPDVDLQREDVLDISSIYDLKEEYYVKISGEVNRTGVYPYAKDMTVGDLILRSNGLKESASNSLIEISRRVRSQDGSIAEIIILDVDPDLNIRPEDKEVVLQPFDHVFIRRSPGFQRERIVEIEGEVLYPGDFVLRKTDERISDLLNRAGGLNQYAYAEGATLIRRTENYKELREEERKIKTLQAIIEEMNKNSLDKSETNREQLQRMEARIAILKEEQEKRQAKKKLSEQILIEERITDTTFIQPQKREMELVGIELKKIIANPGSKYDLILQEGDILSIPKELQTVRMRGEVLYPTTARYDDRRNFRDYISGAGGFTEQSRKARSYVVYANGDVKRTKSFLGINFYPEIKPGAEIIVPQKPDREPMSPQAWVSIGSGLATIALLITQIIGG